MSIEKKAYEIASKAHKGVFRKWEDPNTEYIVHPIRIVEKLKTLPNTDEIDYASAYLHDVLEDVAIPNNELEYYNQIILINCGQKVLNLVWELTDPSSFPEFKNKSRKEKREKDWEHIKSISLRAKRIKIIDRYDNLIKFEKMPKKLLMKYIPESLILLDLIKEANPVMANELNLLINKIKNTLL